MQKPCNEALCIGKFKNVLNVQSTNLNQFINLKSLSFTNDYCWFDAPPIRTKVHTYAY